MGRKLCVLLLIFLLLTPILQQVVGLKNCDYVLSGYNDDVVKPHFTWHDFLSGRYQEQQDIYLQQNVSFKGFLIALKNQIDYSFFNILHYTIEQGDDGQLFFWNHIDTHCGHLSISDDSLQIKIRECEYLKSELDSMGINCVYVLAPGKPSYLEDKIPLKYKGKCSADNDYHHVLTALNNASLPVIDYNEWFRATRDSFKYPAFPKLGIHWSYYAACRVMDTLDNYIGAITHSTVQKPERVRTVVTDQPYKTDKDLWALLNLLLPMQSDSLAYPEYRFRAISNNKKPKVLIIGDSFGWVLIDTKIPANAFSPDSRYWFYKRQLYDLNSKWISDNPSSDEIYKALKDADLVIFLSTEISNYRLDFEFTKWLKANKVPVAGMVN